MPDIAILFFRLFRRPARQIIQLGKWLVVLLTWIMIVLTFKQLVFEPWTFLVDSSLQFIVYTAAVMASIFMCSCAEIAISETKGDRIRAWLKEKTNNLERQQTLGQRFYSSYADYVTGHTEIINPVIILANMTIVIMYTSVVLPKIVGHISNPGVLAPATLAIPFLGSFKVGPLSHLDAFTGIGVTLALFLIAELLPKQIAMKWRMGSLIYTAWWVTLVGCVFLVPAYGMAKPISKFLGKKE